MIPREIEIQNYILESLSELYNISPFKTRGFAIFLRLGCAALVFVLKKARKWAKKQFMARACLFLTCQTVVFGL